MKKLFVLTLVVFSFYASSGQNGTHFPFRPIRTIITDLNNDNTPDTIVLISSLGERNSFNKISISLSGGTKKVFKARDYWTVVDSEFLVANKNAFHTKLLFLKKTNKHTAILLFGEMDPAGYRGEFSIINIESGKIAMPFDQFNNNNGELDVEVPITLTDLEHNDRLCFIYRDLGEIEKQVDKGDIGTYYPYFVYPVGDDCILNKPLTKKYNEDHYIFAGFKWSEKLRILYPHNGGKPSVWKK